MGNNKAGGVHNGLVLKLKLELLQRRNYEQIFTFWQYSRFGHTGEVDLLAQEDGRYDFYEVKCTRTNQAKIKARSQYERWRKAYPRRLSRGFLYTPQRGVERL